ncbi:MAG: response regulator transcription factor [Acidobacteriota bacterium]
MKVLIAEDDATSRRMLQLLLEKWDYEVIVTSDGNRAWEALGQPNPPRLAILDWMMPGQDGIEVIRRIRQSPAMDPPYIILLTARGAKGDVVAGLEAGANDYLGKPFDSEELRARIRVGERMLALQSALAERILQLENAISHVKTLQGVLPICSHCHRIRTDEQSWTRIEKYLTEHTDARLSHGICPSCLEKYYSDWGEPLDTA